jgi:flavorubredoxin
MQSTVTEIARDVFRISTFHAGFGIQFNQFLVRDDEPLLFHTGMRKMFSATQEAVSSLIDPVTLRWIGFSHFEPDESGALNEFLALAPREPYELRRVTVMLDDFADRRRAGLADGECSPPPHRLRFLAATVPHCWDARTS